MLRFAGRDCGSGNRVWPFPATPGLRVKSVSWKLAPRKLRGGGPGQAVVRGGSLAEVAVSARSLRGRPDAVGVGGVTRLPNGMRVRDSEGPSAPRPDRAETEPRGRPQVRRVGAPSGSSRCGSRGPGPGETSGGGGTRGRDESAVPAEDWVAVDAPSGGTRWLTVTPW